MAKRKANTTKVVRLEFPETGTGFHIGIRQLHMDLAKAHLEDKSKPELGLDTDDAVYKLDIGMQPPVVDRDNYYQVYGKIKTDTFTVGTSPTQYKAHDPMEYAELVKDEAGQTVGEKNVNFAYTMKEFNKRVKKGQIQKAIDLTKRDGHPLVAKVLEIPNSSIIYGDKYQIAYDKRIKRTVQTIDDVSQLPQPKPKKEK